MIAIRDLELFVITAEAGSLSAAARRLDLTPAAASASLKRLETELGTRFFVRSTRSQRLTHEGVVFLQHCQQALLSLAEGREALLAGHPVVRGVLQLSAPSDLGRNLLLPWLDEFHIQHPDLQLRLQLTDRIADIYRQPVDIALRYGPPPDSQLVALPVVPGNRRILCAAPSYIERHGRPETPADLSRHNCLTFMLSEYVHDRWRFYREGVEQSVQVHGNRVSDDGDVVRRWALAGFGVAYKSTLDIAQDLQAGSLVALCPEWTGESAPLNLICADRRQLSPVVNLLREFFILKTAACLDTIRSLGAEQLKVSG
jgi:DNA-binding transcriptional LysR family regulator